MSPREEPAAGEQLSPATCTLCRGRAGDPELRRAQVWEDRLWRLTMSLGGYVRGFSYLEPKRHIAGIAELDGEEAATLGAVLAKVTRALREASGAERVYVYVFGGGIPHLHLHLAPHRAGDALNDRMLRGEITEQMLPSGAVRLISREFPAIPEELQRATAEAVQRRLTNAGAASSTTRSVPDEDDQDRIRWEWEGGPIYRDG